MLPDTTGRFSLIQVNDNNPTLNAPGGMTAAQVQQEAPYYDAVWGSFMPSAWDSAHPGMYVSRYVLPNEDIHVLSGHDLSWFQQNHPDWILYACDANNNPTQDLPSFGTGFGDVPLDIHNPDVVKYQLQLLGTDMVNSGYNALAVDNVIFSNYSFAPNHEFGEGPAQSGWYACGIYQNGTFVRRYSGGRLAADPTWIADMQNWIATAKNYLATDPTVASHHFKLLVNHPPYSFAPTANEVQMLQNVDGMLDENGFTNYGKILTGQSFANTLNWMEYLQNHNIAVFITDYYCYTSCSTDPQSLTPSQVDWALATYALGNNGGAGVYISPKGGGIYTYRSEYSTRYGAACGAFQDNNYLYSRRFSGGFALANAGSSPQQFQLPAGHVYTDVGGRPVSNPLTVNPGDAYMLTTGGNGCL